MLKRKIMKRPNTLIIEDNLFLVKVLRNLLLYQTGKLEFAQTRDEAKDLINNESFELILSDFHLGEQTSLPILESLNKIHPRQMVVFMSSDVNALQSVKDKFSVNKFWAFVNKNESDWLVQIQDAISSFKGSFDFGKTA